MIAYWALHPRARTSRLVERAFSPRPTGDARLYRLQYGAVHHATYVTVLGKSRPAARPPQRSASGVRYASGALNLSPSGGFGHWPESQTDKTGGEVPPLGNTVLPL
eukprot:6642424-Prymnesium_polylepis.1